MLAPWKKSYDQPKQNIKKQSYFANKGPSSQSYGFLLGSSPGGSREFEGGDGAASLEMTYLITDRKGLED